MGCWTESCAVSGLAIQENCPCIVFVLRQRAKEVFEECGRLLSTVTLLEIEKHESHAFWYREGHYDDYGGVKEFHISPFDDPDVLVYCLVHRSVWDAIQAWDTWPDNLGRFISPDNSIKRFLYFCKLARITPTMAKGSSFTGFQFCGPEEIKAQRKLNDVRELTLNREAQRLLDVEKAWAQ